MPSLKSDLVRRVERLPKPSRTSDALIPLFEAISNSIHSVQARFKTNVAKRGRIYVTITKGKGRRPIEITVADNGIGLDARNFDAFTTTDTPNKIEIGGKGVGRLLWLDCFERITVSSIYKDGTTKKQRKFGFLLSADEQIIDYSNRMAATDADTGMQVKFSGLRDNGYRAKFPIRLGYVFQHLTSHFLPTFIGAASPVIIVSCGDDIREYPSEVDNYIYRKVEISKIPTKGYGDLRLILMECDKIASSDLDGKHFVHFIAHDRTVKSQKIDSKLGLKTFGPEKDRVFHACLFGDYLNLNVNQERTQFVFGDSVVEDIVKTCMPDISKFLSGPLGTQYEKQAKIIAKIVGSYPSVAFGTQEELRKYIPLGEIEDDAIYAHLSRERFRRDERQFEKIKEALRALRGSSLTAKDLEAKLADASQLIGEAERKSLADYVVRRKVVLDFIELLLTKVRAKSTDSSYQPESLLHSFLCPLRATTVGTETDIRPASHELWLLDERLTFAQYFSSDMAFEKMAALADGKDRPDLLVFDRVHGLRQDKGMAKILMVEFKKPGRTSYEDHENPQDQVERYIRKLLDQKEVDVDGRPIKIDDRTSFYCYIVADRVGRMEDWTFTWSPTPDGRGRIYQPRNGFNGFIELVGWDELVSDAKERNKAFFERSGIPGENLFTLDDASAVAAE